MTPAERLAQFESFLRLDPGNERLRLDAVHAAAQAGETTRAREWLGPQTADETPARRHLRATLLLAERDYAAAAQAFEALRDEGIDDGGVLFNLGYAHLYAGDARAAARALAPLPGREDAPAGALAWLLRALHRDAQLDAAMQAWSAAPVAQRTLEATGVASLVFFDAGQADEASRLADEALALESQAVEPLVVAGTLAVANGDAARSAQLLGRAAERAPGDGRVLSSIGIARMAAGDLAAAEEAFRQSVAALPQHVGIWLALAWCRVLAGRLQQARESVETALALDRTFGEAHGVLAIVDAQEGRREPALDGIERARRLGPRGMAWRYAEAVLEGRSGDVDVVREIARSALAGRAAGDDARSG